MFDDRPEQPLAGVQWADWARDGRLLVATTGGELQVREDPRSPQPSWRHDLAAMMPSPEPPPREAHRWSTDGRTPSAVDRLDTITRGAAMSFDVAADAYDAFMGRWSRLLSAPLADLAGVRAGQRALDVGCGTGALTAELVARLGAEAVSAADPSAPFVGAMRERFPGVDVREAPAEPMPFPDDGYDVTLAQLVVHFMPDPVGGLREMARVTRPGGVVAACVWDHGGQRGPLRDFWAAARTVVPDVDDESDLPGTREGHLEALFGEAGLRAIDSTALTVTLPLESFDAWWEPFTRGVGPAGAFVRRLDADARAALEAECRRRLPPEGPFSLDGVAWAARGLA
jgi:SAM-dependent methyltransferase